MRGRGPGARSLALLAALLAWPGLARGDPAIARRLAALESLMRPRSALEARPPRSAPGGAACPGARWWRMTAYGVRVRIDRAIRDASLRFAVDASLIRSVIRHESAFDPDAVSHADAMGLMQLMPATARALGVSCPFDPRENVLGGTRYLRQLRDRFGSWRSAVAAYHAGPRRVASGAVPAETHRYVERVLSTWRRDTDR